jgi:hypothetical protein
LYILEEECIPLMNSEAAKLVTKMLEKSFNQESDNDSDKTLVEDSDDSLQTVKYSPENPRIINETDSNDTVYSKEKLLNISTLHFFDNMTDSADENEANERTKLSFAHQFIERRQKSQNNENRFLASVDKSNACETITSKLKPPSREQMVSRAEDAYGITKCMNVEPFFNTQSDPDALAQNLSSASLYEINDEEVENLPHFRSSLEGVVGFDNWCKMKINELDSPANKIDSLNLRRELDREKIVTIRPLKRPPDRKSVVAWLEARKKEEKDKQNQQDKDKDKDDKADKADKNSGTQSQDSKNSDTNSIFFDLSFKPGMFKGVGSDNDASKHLGVSCGQIEFNTRSSMVNVEHGNLGNAKALTTVNKIYLLFLTSYF